MQGSFKVLQVLDLSMPGLCQGVDPNHLQIYNMDTCQSSPYTAKQGPSISPSITQCILWVAKHPRNFKNIPYVDVSLIPVPCFKLSLHLNLVEMRTCGQ